MPLGPLPLSPLLEPSPLPFSPSSPSCRPSRRALEHGLAVAAADAVDAGSPEVAGASPHWRLSFAFAVACRFFVMLLGHALRPIRRPASRNTHLTWILLQGAEWMRA